MLCRVVTFLVTYMASRSSVLLITSTSKLVPVVASLNSVEPILERSTLGRAEQME